MLYFIHSYLLDLFLPQNCLGCGRPRERLCVRCLNELPPQNVEEKGVLSIFDYQTPLIKKAIWRLKYNKERPIALRLGQELGQRTRGRLPWPKRGRVLAIPIPLGRQRLAERGFNHAALIAKAFADSALDRFEFADQILVKIRDTPTQVSIKNRSARLANLAGAFAVRNPALVAGQTVILIDDVTTTGATLAEAKQTLKRAGAKQVIALALARG
ncbi:MAG: ComF family protein [Candidatus Vogelbacteria bacterium]|nr:ComF family protein [Candidatus Vogelbacteria bacterium]